MDVSFHPAAREELRQARAWYEERSPLSALGFATEITRAIKQIAESAYSLPAAEDGTRRIILQRFPFSLVYRATKSEVVVVAGAHKNDSLVIGRPDSVAGGLALAADGGRRDNGRSPLVRPRRISS